MNKAFLFILLSVLSTHVFSQNHVLTGRVIDQETKEPLAFVNIVYNENKQGTSTNIDGKFKISTNKNIPFLKLSYVGYDSKTINAESFSSKTNITIELNSTSLNLREVTVLPGINPAHRIINKVIENRDLNNPEKMRSFAYTSYNKMYFTVDYSLNNTKFDTVIVPKRKITIKNDSTLTGDSLKIQSDTIKKETHKTGFRIQSFFNKQHIFLMETVSERRFLHPDKNNEKVIASRVSGLQQPSFVLLATQLQSFSFYSELISISEKKYLNPISSGSTKKYFFQIEDTMYSENNKDTIFIISFRPFKGKNFEGLKGVLQINTHNYAIQTVKAEPYEKSKAMDVHIQQKYELIEDTQWFPVQLNTDIVFSSLQVSEKDTIYLNDTTAIVSREILPLVGIGKTYLKDITLNPELKKKEFSSIEVKSEDDAHKKTEEFWSQYRVDSLTTKDRETYKVIDSVGKVENLDYILTILETVAAGYIPYKFLNFDLAQIMKYNQFEGLRLGLGIMTNEKITKWASVGGFFGYGITDDKFKYGGKFQLDLEQDHEIKFNLLYSYDVLESDGVKYFNDMNITSSEMFREYLIKKMDYVEKSEASFSFKSLKYLHSNLFFATGNKYITDSSRYKNLNIPHDGGVLSSYNNYHFSEVGVNFRYAIKEKFMQTPRGKNISLGTTYPIIWGNITKGLKTIDGEFDYTKFELKIAKKFTSKTIGETSVQITSGYAMGDIPYGALYNGHESYQVFTIQTDNTFNTMRLNEFISNRFASLFFKHNFGKLLFKTEKFQPKFVIVTNIGFGELEEKYNHFKSDYASTTLEKGYYESGLIIDNLYDQSLYGLGLGVYYRYGPYEFLAPKNNFAYKISLTINL